MVVLSEKLEPAVIDRRLLAVVSVQDNLCEALAILEKPRPDVTHHGHANAQSMLFAVPAALLDHALVIFVPDKTMALALRICHSLDVAFVLFAGHWHTAAEFLLVLSVAEVHGTNYILEVHNELDSSILRIYLELFVGDRTNLWQDVVHLECCDGFDKFWIVIDVRGGFAFFVDRWRHRLP